MRRSVKAEGLAALYRQWGRYSESEPLAREALSIREVTNGPDSLEVANVLNVLADSLSAQGGMQEAEPMLVRALNIRRAKLPPDHPDIATCRNSLGAVYELVGRIEDAEKAYKQALSLREKLDPANLDLATTRASLGALYKGQQRYAEAEPLLRSALASREAGLGHRHPDVIVTLSLLGDLYRLLGRPDDAKKYFDRVLELRKDVIRQIPILYGTDRSKVGSPHLTYNGERAQTLS